jgi:hypothetical protein
MGEANRNAMYLEHNTYHDEQEQTNRLEMVDLELDCNMCRKDLLKQPS